MATGYSHQPAAKEALPPGNRRSRGTFSPPADLTDDQKLIGQTAEEIVLKEVFPIHKGTRKQEARADAELVKKAGESA